MFLIIEVCTLQKCWRRGTGAYDIMPTPLLRASPDFQTLQHPCITKVELLLLKLIHLLAREVLLVKQLEIEETKTT